MINYRLTLADKIISLLTVFLFASFFLFETYTWGRYILLGVSFIIFVIMVIKQRGTIHFSLKPWHYYMLSMAFFSLLSAVWGVSPKDSFQKFITIMQIFICLSLVYMYYQENNNVGRLINIVKWAGYFVAIYSFVFYGYEFIIKMLTSAIRLENGFSNVNLIGMLSAMSIIIELYEIKFQKRKIKLSAALCIPSFVLVLATQSRKALALLVIGVFLVLLSTSQTKKNTIKKIGTAVVLIVLFVLLFVFLSRFSIFEGVGTRFGYLLETLQGHGEVGSSTQIRSEMLKLGWKCFLKYPIVGVGFGCPHVIAAVEIGFDAYLHNNYIELLAGGGIVGFILYYSMYYFLFKRFRLYNYVGDYGLAICQIIMILLLIMDFGMVNCYSKEMYFYFMIFFLEIETLRIKALDINNESIAID